VLAQTSKWQLDQPKDLNPAFDDEGVVISEDEDEDAAHDAQPADVSPACGQEPDADATATLIPFPDPLSTKTSHVATRATARQRDYIVQLSQGHATPEVLRRLTEDLSKDHASSIIQALQHQDFSVLAAFENVS